MHEAIGGKTLAEWQAVCEADPNVHFEIYRAGAAVLDHPQLVRAGHVVSVLDPERGTVRQPGTITDIAGRDARVGIPAPNLNQHAALPAAWSPAPIRVAAPIGDAPTSMPLDGVTVVEMAVLFAAPYGATLLTDLGARVIKVEPLDGDPIRMIMPFPESGGAKVMQGKESICVDITTPEGAEIVQRLAARADLVLDGFRPGVTDRHGVGPDALRALNPRLVYVRASGYGQGGPDDHRPAFAPSIGAASGIARANLGDTVHETPGLPMDHPRRQHPAVLGIRPVAQAPADGFAALGVATSLLLGLLVRARAGGQLEGSMLVTAAHAMADQIIDIEAPPRRGPGTDLRGPTRSTASTTPPTGGCSSPPRRIGSGMHWWARWRPFWTLASTPASGRLPTAERMTMPLPLAWPPYSAMDPRTCGSRSSWRSTWRASPWRRSVPKRC